MTTDHSTMTKSVKQLADVKGTPKQYQKLPIVIKAVELKERVRIKTREGYLWGAPGDFLIEGVAGEVYPCGREIFFKTYTEVNLL
jgi:hypothetical protein